MALIHLLCGCKPPVKSTPVNHSQVAQLTSSTDQATTNDQASVSLKTTQPVVLFDSFHAHNFLDRGLIPGEHTYHRFTGLRRAASLLSDRNAEVRELLIGPITPDRLKDVKLIVLNLPSMDRPPWLVSEVEAVEQFIRAGGGMIFITDHTNCYYHQYHLLPLWQQLGLIPTFETVCERTQANLLCDSGPAWLLIRNFEKHPVTDGIRFFGMQSGGRVVGDGIVARTSPDAWADDGLSPLYGEGNPGLSGDLKFTDSEEQGAQGVVLAKSIDRGRVVVISDQNAVGDAQISYADNWRLWLNACNWAGQLKIDTRPLTIDKIRIERAQATNLGNTPDRTPFDELVGSQPDRNANPSLPPGSWQVECWEDLSGGHFQWGSTDEDKFYHLWCWLNRWCWASAHEATSQPAPAGRTLLLANESNLQQAALRARVEQVLTQNGKVVLLASGRGKAENEKNSLSPSEAESWLRDLLASLFSETKAGELASAVQWQKQPITYAQIALGGGTLIAIPAADPLHNASFPAPERAPDATQAKWQRQLYHWLFEQP